MDVGKRITFLREKKGITVNKLANLSGVSQSYLRDIELGKKQPTVEYLEYICYGLDISLKDFFDTDNSSELNGTLSKLTDKQRKKLQEFLETL
ncbi:MAG: helix-turn-helix transcriptional regulator [Ruminococcaceae bacterium]|nr:helix-turn-helix transcriptional regulator [Oscillospiraceae bacterium]